MQEFEISLNEMEQKIKNLIRLKKMEKNVQSEISKTKNFLMLKEGQNYLRMNESINEIKSL